MPLLATLHARIDSQLRSIAALLARADQTNVPNLVHGTVGHSLFFAYYSLLTADEAALDKAVALLESSIAVADSTDQPAAFGTGFTGLCWLVNHLVGHGMLDPEALQLTTDLQAAIIQSFESDLAQQNHDLIYGGIGKLVYFAETNPQVFAPQLEQFVSYCRRMARHDEAGIFWPAGPTDLGNLGLAHGTPGVLLALLNLHGLGQLPEADCWLIHRGIAYLLAQQRASCAAADSLYPAGAAPAGTGASSRLAWCYGDLGIALVLLRAAQAFGATHPQYYTAGVEAALHSAGRTVAQAGVAGHAAGYYDTGWCHGTAGVAQLFGQLAALATAEPRLAAAAEQWLAATVANLAIYLDRFDQVDKRRRTAHDLMAWELENSLLEGLAGTGLVLISARRPALGQWARVFLLEPWQSVGPPPAARPANTVQELHTL